MILFNEITAEYPEDFQILWEQEYLYYIGNITMEQNDLVIIPLAERSLIDNSSAIGKDAQLLLLGFIIVFIYILIMLGK